MKLAKYFHSSAKHLLVIVAGFLVTVSLFELGLMSIGRFRTYSQNRKNNLKPDDEFVILALGESTTMPMLDGEGQDFSWPAQLEQALNETDLGPKFKVVNKGWSGINSAGILDELERNLTQYQPDLVISMIGINDHGHVEYEAAANIEQDHFLAKFRVYRLIKFLINNVREKLQSSSFQSNPDKPQIVDDCVSAEDCVNKADQAKNETEMTLALDYWHQVLEFHPYNLVALRELAKFHLDRREMDKADQYYQLLAEHYSNFDFVQLDLGWFCLLSGQMRLAEKHFRKAIEQNPTNEPAYAGLIYSVEGAVNERQRFEQIAREIENKQLYSVGIFTALAEQGLRLGIDPERFHFQQNIEVISDDPYVLISIARYYVRYQDWDKAEQFYLRSLDSPKAGSLPLVELMELYRKTARVDSIDQELKAALVDEDMFVYNYRQLHQRLREHNIPLIAVQYPVRSAEPLRIIFKDQPGVWVVDNELLFKEQIEEHGYSDLFVDYFGGDFGHCTQLGNQILMNNIKETLILHWPEIQNY